MDPSDSLLWDSLESVYGDIEPIAIGSKAERSEQRSPFGRSHRGLGVDG